MGCSVIGIGSRAGRDDGVGVALVEKLTTVGAPDGVCCLVWENADAATVAYRLLELDTPVLFVDCADMGLEPGAFRFFEEKDARLTVRVDSVSVHGLGLSEAVALARSLGFAHEARFFGVQPFDVAPGLGLSAAMEARLPVLLSALAGGMAKMGSV